MHTDRLLIKRRGSKSAEGGTVIEADPTRYTTGTQKNVPAKHLSKKVELLDHHEDNKVTEEDESIYDETF